MSEINSEKSRKRNRKKEDKKTILILGVVAAVLLVALVFVIIGVGKAKTSSGGQVAAVEVEAADADKQLQKAQSVRTSEAEHIAESAAAGQTGEEAGNGADNVAGNEAVAGAAAGNAAGDAAEAASAPGKTTETEESTEETTAPEEKYLPNLNEYHVNDLIPEDKLDMDDLSKYFVAYEISPEGNVFKRINGKSYVENNNIALSDLRYIQMPYYNFNGKVQLGELIVNKKIASDIISIFEELFRNKYQIEKMELIDKYWTGDGDSSDSNSIDHNNSSAFCYRTATGSGNLSRHALGMAIDINPQQNPYVSYSTGQPKWSHSNANDYIARDTGLPHVITHDDLAFKVFKKYGFTWGGDWNNPKDYQHFELR